MMGNNLAVKSSLSSLMSDLSCIRMQQYLMDELMDRFVLAEVKEEEKVPEEEKMDTSKG